MIVGEGREKARRRKEKQQTRRKESTRAHFANTTTHPNYQEDSEPLEATFELNDTLFAKAHIHRTQEVYLWLGVSPFLSSPSLFFCLCFCFFFLFFTPTR